MLRVNKAIAFIGTSQWVPIYKSGTTNNSISEWQVEIIMRKNFLLLTKELFSQLACKQLDDLKENKDSILDAFSFL